MQYAYPVLPPSVITRIIVRMNQKIDDGLGWHMGVVLKIGKNKALVKSDIKDRRSTIIIDGRSRTHPPRRPIRDTVSKGKEQAAQYE